MDAPNLTPEQSHELDDLRRRAYGGTDDEALSEQDSRRLAELEDLAHAAVPQFAQAAFGGGSEADAARDPLGDVPPPPSSGGADPGRAEPVSTAGRDEPRSPPAANPPADGWRLRRPRVALAVGVGLGVVLGVLGVIALPALVAPRPDLTLAQTDEQWASQWENLLTSYEVVPETMQGHDRLFDVLMVWTAEGIYGDRCLVVGHEPTMRIRVESCTAADRYPTFDLIVTAQVRGVLDGAYPVGTTLRLVPGEEAVDVYVLEPAEEGRVAGG